MLKHTKRIVALLLAAVLLMTSVLPTAAVSVGDTLSYAHRFTYRGGPQSESEYAGESSGSRETHYDNRIYWYNGFTIDMLTVTGDDLTAQYDGKTYAYCIQYHVGYEEDTRVVDSVDESLTTNAYWKSLGRDKQRLLARLMPHAFPACSPKELGVIAVDDAYAATQVIVWEIVEGYRDADGRLIDSTLRDSWLAYTYTGNGHTVGEATPALTAYANIEAALLSHAVTPDWHGGSVSLQWNTETERYEAKLTDQNGVLSQFEVVENGDLHTSISGNTLTVWSETYRTDTVSIRLKKKLKSVDETGMLAVLSSNSNGQTMILAGTVDDPLFATLSVDVKPAFGKVGVRKRDEVTEKPLAGAVFTLYDRIGRTVTTIGPTAADGTAISGDILYGTYVLKETTPPEHYALDEEAVWNVTINEDTPIVQIVVDDPRQSGRVQVVKTAEDGFVEHVKFCLSGSSLYGETIDMTAETNADGVATFENVPIGSGYVLEEVGTPLRYVVPQNQAVAVEWNKVTKTLVDNVLKKFCVTVTKTDRETVTAQGDATLSGATYGIYKGDRLIDIYVTDANGQFTTDNYACDTDWTVREITPSEGYLLDTTVYPVGADSKLYTIEFNTPSLDVTETVEKGKIAIIKHCDDGTTKIETPEVGAEFAVFLKRAGSYAAATESERDLLVCDEYGFAETKELPYGVYTVQQTKGWDGREFMPAFDVFVSEDGEVYRYLINNDTFRSRVKVIKTDSETGKTIPYAGAGFQIYNPDGELVTMTMTYPQVAVIDTFYTSVDGTLVTPEPLERGLGYSLVEVTAPYGYVLDSAPLSFDITADNATKDETVTVVTVTKSNAPQKGRITVQKTGEEFTSVVEANGVYQPIYTETGLAGAVFTVTAAEDVITPDGTVRYAKGEMVAEITTGEDGTATTDLLYLGSYVIQETHAPSGFVCSNEAKTVALTYAGQEVVCAAESVAFYNDRQRVQISLSKMLQQDEMFGIGANGEITAVSFGLFAAEELVAADGSVIPQSGLIEIVSCDENGEAIFQTDLPVGAKLYVQEIATDGHYALSSEKYPVVFEYAGQEVETVHIAVNDGKAIANAILYGTIKGYKLDRETEMPIAGAVFGLFRPDETVFSEDTALLTVVSGEDGVFTFENVPFGDWLVCELQPAVGYLPNEGLYPVSVTENEEVIEITVVNDRIPEIATTATIDGKKEIGATEQFTITDIVAYCHLIPGEEYTLRGVLMDKSIGEPFMVNGEEIRSEVTFVPNEPSGEVTVEFTVDASDINEEITLVVFESLYRNDVELATHADIEDEGQTVRMYLPVIPEAPPTGENTPYGLWLGLAATALGGMIAMMFCRLKKKSGQDDVKVSER